MERYAPTLKDLAPRDFVSRSMDQEIKEGRGCGPNGDYVLLDLSHIGAETIMKRLPSIREIALKFANVDCIKEPIPVIPTIHYQMGGIPTNINGQVVGRPGAVEAPLNGLYAVGECSCVSVHGANRLGTNSLLDLLVFGRAAGNHIIENLKNVREHKPLPADAADRSLSRLAKLQNSTSGEYTQDVANDIRKTMQTYAGVFRTSELLSTGVEKIQEIAAPRRSHSLEGQVEGVQHGTGRSARVGQPDGSRPCDDGFRGSAQGKPRRSCSVGFRASRRRKLDAPHVVVQRRRSPRLQAGAHEAADRRIGAAEGTHVLNAGEPASKDLHYGNQNI